MDKEQIKEKIKNFKSDEEISNFIKERILFDATQSAQPNWAMESIGNFPIPKFSVFTDCY